MAVLLKTALAPNLVQTLENNPAFIHGGPFANIAHGCNSVIATKMAMRLSEYTVTEAGFGADLGAEKFLDIKCRRGSIRRGVIVATVRAKHHGRVDRTQLNVENLAALEGARQPRTPCAVKDVYGIPCVVSINRFTADTQAEMDLLTERIGKLGVKVVVATHWADGGKGAAELARIVVELCEQKSSPTFVYEDADPLWEKMKKIATRVYVAADVTADTKVRNRIKELQESGYGHYPVCVAKRSRRSPPIERARAPSGHVVNVREVRLAAARSCGMTVHHDHAAARRGGADDVTEDRSWV
jgi:formate--tetrahydrofolate ligase